MTSWSTVMIMPRISVRTLSSLITMRRSFLAHYLEHELTPHEEQDIGEALELAFHETMSFIVKMDNVLLDKGDHQENYTLEGMTRGVSREENGKKTGVKGKVIICFLPFIDKIDPEGKNHIAYSAIAPNMSMHAKNQVNRYSG